MKKFLLFALLPLTLFAQEFDDALFRVENDPPPGSPFSIAGSYLSVAPATFRSPGFSGQHLTFRQWEAALSYKHPFSPAWGLLFGAGWVGTEVNMEENPEFHEKIFTYVNGLIGAYTEAFPDWLWKVTFSCFIDTEEYSLVDYALYQGVLWGKYDLCSWMELDFGLIAETGLRRTKVWPLIGFICMPSPKWAISIVYPVDISVNYTITKSLAASASLRFLRNRHRLKDTEPNSQGIFEYKATGIEVDLSFSPTQRFFIKGFAGSTTPGELKVGDRKDNNAIHFKFNGAFYAGLSALLAY